MRKRNLLSLTCLLAFVTLMFWQAEGYIQRRYTVEQIVEECTNIVTSTVTEVNAKRLTVKLKVGENLKGKSEFEVIQLRLDVGQANYPQKVLKLLARDTPAIVFYAKEGARLDCLVHARGTWFQVKGQDRRDKSKVWWGLTHIEKYLNDSKSSKRTSTPKFQEELKVMLHESSEARGPGALRLLMLRNASRAEHQAVSRLARELHIAYDATGDRSLPGLSNANILWLGYRALSADKYRLHARQEARIRDFVKNGGVVIVSGQDSDENRPCKTGWLPEPLRGVESPQRNSFKPTAAAGRLFTQPNRIRSGKVAIDDGWSGWNKRYEVLATTDNGKEIVVAMLKHGKGIYLITSLHNRTASNVSRNRPMLENLLHFALDFLSDSE